MGEAYDEASKEVGRPIFWHCCMGAFFHGIEPPTVPERGVVAAAGTIARHVQAISAFGGSFGAEQPDIARAVKAAGAERGTPLGMFQKENIFCGNYAGKGLDWMWGQRAAVREQEGTLLQLVTWNDHGENSNVAPAPNSRCTLYDLTGTSYAGGRLAGSPRPTATASA